jgi:hypothetical protein
MFTSSVIHYSVESSIKQRMMAGASLLPQSCLSFSFQAVFHTHPSPRYFEWNSRRESSSSDRMSRRFLNEVAGFVPQLPVFAIF